MLELAAERSKQRLLERIDGQLELDDEREEAVHEAEARLEFGQLKPDALEELQLRHELVDFGRALGAERSRVEPSDRVLQQSLQLLVLPRGELLARCEHTLCQTTPKLLEQPASTFEYTRVDQYLRHELR